jgi:hemerythrin-like domain-containing protein
MSTHKSDNPNAIDLLLDDHKRIKKLFKEFDKAAKKGDRIAKVEIALQLCEELSVHAAVEEDLFYPALRTVCADNHLLNEAQVEHDSAHELIAQILNMSGEEALYDAKIAVLREHIERHIAEEENELLPQARKSTLDLHKLANAMQERKLDMTIELV